MKTKRFFASILTASMALSLTACGPVATPPSTPKDDNGTKTEAPKDATAAAEKVIQLGHTNPSDPDDQYQYWCNQLNDYLQTDEFGGGKIQFQVFTDSSLGTETELFTGVSDSSVDSALVSNNIVSGSVNELELFDLPYMFDAEDEYQYLADNEAFIEPIIKKLDSDWNIHVFGPILDASWRTLFTSKKPVKSFADMKDLKVRVTTNRVHEAAFKALGTIPSVIAWNECYTAFQQGVIDGLDVGIPISKTMGFYNEAKYCTKDNPFPIIAWPMISNKLWDSLSAEEQGWITDAAAKASADQRTHQREMEQKFQKEMEDVGIEFFEIDLTEFKEATKGVHEEFRSEIGSDLLDNAYKMLEEYRAAK